MSSLNLKSRSVTGVRVPVIVNQLGPEVRLAIAGHWSLPSIIDHPADRLPWQIPAGVDVLGASD
jgi:hypothetical protein